jgi:hypothetical protein
MQGKTDASYYLLSPFFLSFLLSFVLPVLHIPLPSQQFFFRKFEETASEAEV